MAHPNHLRREIVRTNMSKSKLSRRVTWRVILIMVIFNVFIIGAVFVFDLIIADHYARHQIYVTAINERNEKDIINTRCRYDMRFNECSKRQHGCR